MHRHDATSTHPEMSGITQLLDAWNGGDREALDRLIPLVYSELRGLARQHMGHERSAHTLRSTALVHEAYLRLSSYRAPGWKNRTHFFGAASNVMRRILVDCARRKLAAKRGGFIAPGVEQPLDQFLDRMAGSKGPQPDLIAIDQLLDRLEAVDPQQARVVELYFFGGFTHGEIAAATALSVATVKREWSSARAWFHYHLKAA